MSQLPETAGVTQGFRTGKEAFFTDCPLCGGKRFFRKYRLTSLEVRQCSFCGMIFLNPYRPPSEMTELYSSRETMGEANPRLETYYENLPGSRTEAFFDLCLEKLNRRVPASPRTLLDIGCGNGYFLSRAKRRGWNVKGIEPSEEAGREASKKFQAEVFYGTFEEFPGGELFDAVSLWDLIEHTPQPKALLRKVYGRLKPGGFLLLATPNHSSLINGLAHLAYRASGGLVRGPLELLFVQEHILYFTERTIRRAVEESGFRILEILKNGTDIDRYRTSRIFNLAAKAALTFSRWLRWENRVTVLAQKIG